MKIVACTGGIGSGKTYVATIFENMGIPVYYSDIKTKELYNTSKELLAELCNVLGDEIVVDGLLQKAIMASKIFGDAKLMAKVESIVHPAVVADFYKWQDEICSNSKYKRAPFVLFESAIILEKPKVREIADKIITVTAPLEMRINRVVNRDNVTKELVEARLDSQWSDEQRLALSDFIIFADNKHPLVPQVVEIIDALK